jgi:hypothetical protein
LMGPSITRPIIQGPTDQHSSSGHLQLAQQLTGVMGHSSSGLTLFGQSALHFYHGPSSVFSDVSTRDSEPLLPSPASLPRDLQVSQPLSSPFFTDTLGSHGISHHAYQPDFQQFPMSSQPQVYTNPIISLPPSTVQPSPHPTPNPSAYKIPNIIKSSHSRPSRSSPRLHHFQRTTSASMDHGKNIVSVAQDLDGAAVYPSPFSELSKVSGYKRVVVSDISDLFPNPSKKLNMPNTTQDRMSLAAHSLSALKNSPTAPTTPFLLRVSGPSNLAPFTLAQSSVAESSPTTRVDSVGLQPSTMPLSRKVYKAGKKSRSVTQLLLLEAESLAVANTSAPLEAASFAMPPLDI